MRTPAACLFDLDGLLLDTEPLHARAWQQAALQFGLALEPDQLLALRGRRRLDCAEQVRHWFIAAAQTPPSVDALLAVRQPMAEALLPSALPMVGAADLIAALEQRGLPMALVTSSSSGAVALKAAPHPWLEAIRERVHGDDPALAAGKPEPDPYLLAAQRLGVSAGDCWAFEDSPAGAQAAAAAGCRVHVLLPADAVLATTLLQHLPVGCVLLSSLEEVLAELSSDDVSTGG
jgi:pseudouridine-5'-monophosphatase